MLVASPIISAVVFDPERTVSISGSKSIKISGDSADYHYVINSKLGFLASLDVRQYVTPKDDFRRFRMIAASMQSQWSGPELFKAGVQVTARLTDKENIADFNPNEKADNVISNVSDVLVTTCQHADPVFDFKNVDENNDEGGGAVPNAEIGRAHV